MAHDIPRDRSLDSTVALLREGYLFFPRRTRRFRSDIFRSRLLGEKAVWISGAEAAAVFYDQARFVRSGAVPQRIQKTLFGEGGVQSLDDDAHRHRKAMFMSLMSPASIADLVDLTSKLWRAALAGWTEAGRVVLFTEAQDILCRAACAWTGVPLDESEVRRRAREFGAMVDGLAAVGPRYWVGRLARRSSERWIVGVIERVRRGELEAAEGTALRVFCEHRDLNGALLDAQIAAVEIINLLRPIVAISTYITFAALAMHEHPNTRQALRDGGAAYAEWFIHEVRRFYPLTPLLGARVRERFVWHDYTFEEGTRVLLDVYGTNRDPQRWERAEEFLPERFKDRIITRFDFIPQGGGDHDTGHRCAGEAITIEILKVAAAALCLHMDYEVPTQDLSFSLERIPTLPRSGFMMRNVRSSLPELDHLERRVGAEGVRVTANP